MGRIQREFQDRGVKIVAVNTAPWSSLAEWKDFWKSKGGGDVVWATDGTQAVVNLFRVATLGTTIIIDLQRHVSYRDGGATSYEILKTQVERALRT